MAVADWCIANGHPDPASAWRGSYRSEAEWRTIVAKAGGLTTIFTAALAALAHPEKPEPGCIGVIGSAHAFTRQWAAIFDGNRWQVRQEWGFAPLTARPLAIWRV